MRRIRFLSYNIHGGRGIRRRCMLENIHALMHRFDIDIGVFQEMDTRVSRGRSQADVEKLAGAAYPHRLFGISMEEPGGGWYGNMIISRHPILQGKVYNLETGPELEPRNAADALIDTPYGKLRVIGTHLSLSYLERRSEAQNLLRLMRAVEYEEHYPLFLMGDINEWQWRSRLLSFLDSAMVSLPCAATFPAIFPLLKLDRIWYDATHLKVHAHRLKTTELQRMSDHLPLLVEAEF